MDKVNKSDDNGQHFITPAQMTEVIQSEGHCAMLVK
jgi:hypothetical protein